MATKSVYLPQPVIEDETIRIRDEEHRHLVVGRAVPGESLEVFDGYGNLWNAVVRQVGKRETLVVVEGHRVVPPPSTELILGQALIRPSAFELALEKAVEVGVTRILPISTTRSNVLSPRRQDRWHRIIVEAAKQSKRYHLPKLDSPMRLDQVLAFEAPTKIMFAERDGGPLKSAISGTPVLYLIGPEGGWTAEELGAAQSQGFKWVSLGSGILRAETAAIAGAVLIRYELGDM